MSLTNSDFRSLLNKQEQSVLKDIAAHKKKKAHHKHDEVPKKDEKEKTQKRPHDTEQETPTATSVGTGMGTGIGTAVGVGIPVGVATVAKSVRDRAEERRRGLPEYQQAAREHDELRNKSVEESKYYGGDIEHTHMVKGLDISLLNKVRAEIDRDTKKKQAMDSVVLAHTKHKAFVSHTGQKMFRLLFENLHPHQLQLQNKLKKIQSVIFTGARFRGNTENFLPSRMKYNFDLDMHMKKTDTPTVVYTAKEDCPPFKPSLIAVPKPEIYKELKEIVEWFYENKKRKKTERPKTRLSQTPKSLKKVAAHTEDEPMEMFAGSGDFDPSSVGGEELQKSNTTDAPKINERRSYFDKAESGDEEMPYAPPSLPAALQAKLRRREQERVSQASRPKRLPSDAATLNDDTYTECYPGEKIELSFEAYQEGDEEDDVIGISQKYLKLGNA